MNDKVHLFFTRKEHDWKNTEQHKIDKAIEILEALPGAKCSNGEDIIFKFNHEDVPSINDQFRTRCSISDQLLEDKTDDIVFITSANDKRPDYICQEVYCRQSYVSERFLATGDSVYCASFVSMLKDQSHKPAQPLESLRKIASLFDSVQIVFALQVVIFLLLVISNWEKDLFQKPTPSFFIMRMVTAFMFHIYALSDSRDAYQNLKFLVRYPDRFEAKLRFSAYVICVEQFIITLLVEFMNLMFLCKQDNYEDLIMNYVAFAGILGIDNDFMNIQKKNHP